MTCSRLFLFFTIILRNNYEKYLSSNFKNNERNHLSAFVVLPLLTSCSFETLRSKLSFVSGAKVTVLTFSLSVTSTFEIFLVIFFLLSRYLGASLSQFYTMIVVTSSKGSLYTSSYSVLGS